MLQGSHCAHPLHVRGDTSPFGWAYVLTTRQGLRALCTTHSTQSRMTAEPRVRRHGTTQPSVAHDSRTPRQAGAGRSCRQLHAVARSCGRLQAVPGNCRQLQAVARSCTQLHAVARSWHQHGLTQRTAPSSATPSAGTGTAPNSVAERAVGTRGPWRQSFARMSPGTIPFIGTAF